MGLRSKSPPEDRKETINASNFSEAKKVCILRHGDDGTPVAEMTARFRESLGETPRAGEATSIGYEAEGIFTDVTDRKPIGACPKIDAIGSSVGALALAFHHE